MSDNKKPAAPPKEPVAPYHKQLEGAQEMRKLFGPASKYGDRYLARRSALQDAGLLSEFDFAGHMVNEVLYDLLKRVAELEAVLAPAPEFIEEHEPTGVIK